MSNKSILDLLLNSNKVTTDVQRVVVNDKPSGWIIMNIEDENGKSLLRLRKDFHGSPSDDEIIEDLSLMGLQVIFSNGLKHLQLVVSDLKKYNLNHNETGEQIVSLKND